MKNYDTIRKLCEKNSRIAAKVVDGFLLGFAARHHGLEGKMNKQFARFRHVIRKFESGSGKRRSIICYNRQSSHGDSVSA